MASKDRTDMKSLPLVKDVENSGNDIVDGVTRRRWLQLMGASTALGAAASGCRFEEEVIQTFARRPEGYIPGVPVKKSALCEIGGLARSLMATVFDGRPIKVDGNDLLEAQSNGTTSLIQAITLDMYDPDRSRSVVSRAAGNKRAEVESFAMFTSELQKALAGSVDGSGMAFLAEPTSSPTVRRLKDELLAKYPNAKWYEYSPINQDAIAQATEQVFGQALLPNYKFANAKTVLALDSDPFGKDLNQPEYARDFMSTRDVEKTGSMSRLWSVESTMTGTGALADERLPLAASKISSFLAELESVLDGGEVTTAGAEGEFVKALADDLKSNAGHSVIVVGATQPADVHARAWKINAQLKAIGSTVEMMPTSLVEGGSLAAIATLSKAIEAGDVKQLYVLGGNPAFSAPGNLEFSDKLSKVPFSVHLGLYDNETAGQCTWHVNQAHSLESWTDGRAADGTHCIGQPAINPLFGGKTTIEFLAMLLNSAESGMEQIQATTGLSGEAWETALHNGFVADSKIASVSAQVGNSQLPLVEGDWAGTKVPSSDAAEVVFIEGSVYDGSFANNGWLQEMPDSISKVTWGNAALMSPGTAAAWGLKQNQIVNIALKNGSIKLPVHLVPGTAAGVVAVAFGYGRKEAGRVGGSSRPAIRCKSVGVDVAPVRTSDSWNFHPAEIQGTSTFEDVATTQEHHYVDTLSLSVVNERVPRLAREGTLESFLAFQQNAGGHAAEDHAAEDHAAEDHAAVDNTEDGHAEDGHDHDEHDHDEHEHGHEGHAQDPFLAPIGMTGTEYGSQPGVEDGAPRLYQQTAEEVHHHHSWPELGGHHFPNFDLTPGPAYYDAPKWAMSIDLNKCTGCGSCVTACQAENNISIVGKPQVLMGREMHWIRVDRYFLPRDNAELTNPEPGQESFANPKVVFQPVTCHHCEKAPCETVCPVAATVHSDEGLNDMVYNRCIGTRYCGNNCPYKVRKFNYHNWSNAVTFVKYPDALASLDGARRLPDGDVKLMGLGMNPEVTIRSRGVMEKCTFCVQRIQNGKINARNEGRNFRNGDFRDGEVTTACQDVCSTNAIVFGDASQQDSGVAQNFASPRAYAMLNELNIIPRLKYLARVRNPHPALVPAGSQTEETAKSESAHA